MEIVCGKEIKGFCYADGTHWFWGDTEVAVINEKRREIEWCNRIFKFPKEVVEKVRSKLPTTPGVWIIEARRVACSATGGNIHIFVNNNDMGMTFDDKYELAQDGNWHSMMSDEELGKCVYACLWHKYDNVYHYSDRFKDLFNPDWRKEIE